MHTITTRLATPEEFDVLTALYLRAMRPLLTAARGTWDEGHEQARFRPQLDPATTWVIEQHGAVVGLYMLTEFDTEDALYNLCVDPQHQGEGIGRQVVERFVARARKRDRGAMLWVSKDNQCAKRLYEAQGFSVRDENEKFRDYVMRYTGVPGASYVLTADAGALGLTGYAPTLWLHATFAPAWFQDAQRESALPGIDARRHEILFAVCFIESYLLEWTRDQPLKRDFKALANYLPLDDRRGIIDRWKAVTRALHSNGLIPAHPDYLHSSAWADFIKLVRFRDGLVHARTGRPQTADTPEESRPRPTVDDLHKMEPGWPTRVVVALVRELHEKAGTELRCG